MPNRVNRLMVRQEVAAAKTSGSIIFVGYRGLTVAEVEALRKALGTRSMDMRVVRNRMYLKALTELGRPDCSDVITGPTAIIDAECPVTAAKTAMEFAKRHPKLELKGGLIDGDIFDKKGIENLARTGRTKAEWLSTISGCLLAPYRKAASDLNVGGKLAGAIKAKAEKDGKGSSDAA